MCQLLAEEQARGIVRQRGLAARDGGIDDPEILLDDVHSGGVELGLSLTDDPLKRCYFLSIHLLRVLERGLLVEICHARRRATPGRRLLSKARRFSRG